MSDNNDYLSNTISYIGSKYLLSCCDRYKTKYKQLHDEDLLIKMCEVLKISIDKVKNNEKNSGGAQYLIKNVDYKYWEDVEKDSVNLYYFFVDYVKKYPIEHHVQKWCADMWAVLWNLWKREKIL